MGGWAHAWEEAGADVDGDGELTEPVQEQPWRSGETGGGDGETGRPGPNWAYGRMAAWETGRRGDGETGRREDGEMGRRGGRSKLAAMSGRTTLELLQRELDLTHQPRRGPLDPDELAQPGHDGDRDGCHVRIGGVLTALNEIKIGPQCWIASTNQHAANTDPKCKNGMVPVRVSAFVGGGAACEANQSVRNGSKNQAQAKNTKSMSHGSSSSFASTTCTFDEHRP